jgi:hypothetical protein
MSVSSSEESVEATCYARYEDLHLPDPSCGRYRSLRSPNTIADDLMEGG